jgi:hypothetical protein
LRDGYRRGGVRRLGRRLRNRRCAAALAIDVIADVLGVIDTFAIVYRVDLPDGGRKCDVYV